MNKILIIGNGKWSKTVQRALNELGHDFIVATYDWKIKLSQINRAIVATPAPTHFYITNELLRNKIPTLIEKPAVLTFEHAEILEHHQQLTNTPLFCHTPYLYHALIKKMKQDLANFKYLDYHSIRFNTGPSHRDGNSFVTNAPHDLANLWYFGIRRDLTNWVNYPVPAFNAQVDIKIFNGHFNISTANSSINKVRYLRANNIQIVDDKYYIKDGNLIEGLSQQEPIKESLKDFIENLKAPCGIDFIKWSAKFLEQVIKI